MLVIWTCLAKLHPVFPATFCRWEAGFSCLNCRFQYSLYLLYGSWRHRITSKGKVGLSRKVKATVKVSCWVPLAYHICPVEIKTKQWLILVLATCQEFHFHFQTCRVRRCIYSTPVTAACQQLRSIDAASLCIQFLSLGLALYCHTSVIQMFQLSAWIYPLVPMCSDKWLPIYCCVH